MSIKLHVCVIYLSIRLQQITQTSLFMIHDIMLNPNICLLAAAVNP